MVSFASNLPQKPSELDVVLVKKEGVKHFHKDFQVRRHVVHTAMQWLLANKEYYRANQVHIDHNALVQLSDDENLSEGYFFLMLLAP